MLSARWRKGMTRVGVILASVGVLTSCATPVAHHVGSVDAGLFLDVPYDWKPISEQLIKKAETGWQVNEAGTAIVNAMVWQNVWVLDSTFSVDQVFSNNVPDSPYVFASARQLYDGEKSALTTDVVSALQDVVMPVSTAQADDGLTIVSNRAFTIDNREGLSQVLRWKTKGVQQELRALILLSTNRTMLYTVVSRCSTVCIGEHSETLNGIFKTVTIKEPNGV